jgi:hypothetical protein
MRIFWLLNHKTLVDFEVPVLVKSGWEVLTPKKYPAERFRSSSVSYDYDQSLTIPNHVLEKLNNFNFYEEEWSPLVTYYLNKYFDVIFTFPHYKILPNSLKRFMGVVVLRLFGQDNYENYYQFLQQMYGFSIIDQIEARKDKLITGFGYLQSLENESDLLTKNAVYLPIGVPSTFYKFKNSHKGGTGKVLLVCPNRITGPYSVEQFKRFSETTLGIGRIIVDSEDEANGDSEVVFNPNRDDLLSLYIASDCFYTPTTAKSHTLYSPIEALIVGLPLVFHSNSLLGNMFPKNTIGAVASKDEARHLIKAITDGESSLVEDIKKSQQGLGELFHEDNLIAHWNNSLEIIRLKTSLGFGKHKKFTGTLFIIFKVRLRVRSLLRKITEYSKRQVMDFRSPLIWEASDQDIPDWVDPTQVSINEYFGRWVISRKLVLKFSGNLPKQVFVRLEVTPFSVNNQRNLKVRLKPSALKRSKKTKLRINEFTIISLSLINSFHLANSIEISVPKIGKSLGDHRYLAFAVKKITIFSEIPSDNL